MLDSHGIPAPFLDIALQRAAEEFGLPNPPLCDSPAMTAHKEQERDLADVIVFCSELQKKIWVGLGVAETKTRAIPLWVDTSFWKPTNSGLAQSPTQRLKVCAVGAGSLAKGLPYLLDAARQIGPQIELTLVGGISPSLRSLVGNVSPAPNELPYLNRVELREFLSTQELLVMPSLGDSFGFVAMEAMACGLPVIVTDHCGVPVPVAGWRVPAHDSASISTRLQHYLDYREKIGEDSLVAREFAARFAPQRYRDQIKTIYQELLTPSPIGNKD